MSDRSLDAKVVAIVMVAVGTVVVVLITLRDATRNAADEPADAVPT